MASGSSMKTSVSETSFPYGRASAIPFYSPPLETFTRLDKPVGLDRLLVFKGRSKYNESVPHKW